MKNRTLNRPMFRRGGKVDSRGTGITSGLMPRKNYAQGDLVVQGTQPTITQTTQPEGPSRFSQSYVGGIIKNVNDLMRENVNIPVSQAFAEGIYNPASTAVNAMGSLIGYGDISPYLQSNITKNDLFAGKKFPELVSKEEYFNRPLLNKTTTDVSEAVINEDMNQPNALGGKTVSMDDEKKAPDVEDTSNMISDIDTMEEVIDSDAKAFERIMLGDNFYKDRIFRMLTAAAPKLLDEDYGGAIEAAGEAGDDSKTKETARSAAINKYLSDNAKSDKGKQLNELKDIFPDASKEELAGYVFGSGIQDAPNPITLRANADKIVSESIDAGALKYSSGYAAGLVAQQLNPDVTMIKYALEDPTKIESKDNPLAPTIQLAPGEIYFDPKKNKYAVGYSDGKVKYFGSYQQASMNKDQL
tara:strand:- start:3954 stop:5195 length:1242 start_codon:yes stop_codon:yes gene_type:complete